MTGLAVNTLEIAATVKSKTRNLLPGGRKGIGHRLYHAEEEFLCWFFFVESNSLLALAQTSPITHEKLRNAPVERYLKRWFLANP